MKPLAPTARAVDNQVPEHCQHLICLPVGTRGYSTASISHLPIRSSLKSVGAREQLCLLPLVGDPASISSQVPGNNPGGLTVSIGVLARALPRRPNVVCLSLWQEVLEPDHYS